MYRTERCVFVFWSSSVNVFTTGVNADSVFTAQCSVDGSLVFILFTMFAIELAEASRSFSMFVA